MCPPPQYGRRPSCPPPQYGGGYNNGYRRPCPPQYGGGYNGGRRPYPPQYGGGYGGQQRPYLGSVQRPIRVWNAQFSDVNPGGYVGP